MRYLTCLPTLGLILTLGASAGAEESTSKVTVESLAVSSAEVVTQASTGGASALDLITSARTKIASGDYAAATTDLTNAQSQLAELRKLNPAASLQDAIQSAQAKLDSDGAEAAYADLMPVSESLTVVDDYEDAVAQVKIETEKQKHIGGGAAKQHIARSLDRLKVKDVEQARVELQAAYETAVYTEVDLPVAASYATVTHALEALQDGAKKGYDKGYAKVADEHLAASQSSAETIVQVASGKAVNMDVSAGPN